MVVGFSGNVYSVVYKGGGDGDGSDDGIKFRLDDKYGMGSSSDYFGGSKDGNFMGSLLYK